MESKMWEVRIIRILLLQRRRNHVFDRLIRFGHQIRRVLLSVYLGRVGRGNHVPSFEGELKEEIVDCVEIGRRVGHSYGRWVE